jgi:Flp pilus assembly protein TadD
VPFEGGKARLMNCNLSLMNSWHTFSPNGHWLAFSSKDRGPYTRLMLTHIDANGNDTPAIIVDDTTAANRAVNIPEFVNAPMDGLEKIDPQATEFYRLFDQAYALMENDQLPEAITVLREAIARNPDDAVTHYVLATALSGNNQESEALEEYRKACALAPANAAFFDHLAVSLALNGHPDEAVEQLQKAIALVPAAPEYRFNLGVLLESRGDNAGAVAAFQKAVELSRGKNWQGLAELAKAYDKTGRTAEAIEAIKQALGLTVAQHDEQDAQALREVLEGYEREGAKAQPQ